MTSGGWRGGRRSATSPESQQLATGSGPDGFKPSVLVKSNGKEVELSYGILLGTKSIATEENIYVYIHIHIQDYVIP